MNLIDLFTETRIITYVCLYVERKTDRQTGRNLATHSGVIFGLVPRVCYGLILLDVTACLGQARA
ncbi:hypothetical protein DXM27_10815 [Rhizobium rhizogenes]|uniref:Uncharacterized protein n=1 Tax=Rhizobium rhizogenes TaxID=359 RepID=A0AA88EZ13_RHIRH|nr:hypothetical protein DXM27_10815 [Rhizobium rhizogenes]